MRIYKCEEGHTWKFPEQTCPVCKQGWIMTLNADNDNKRVIKNISDTLELIAKQESTISDIWKGECNECEGSGISKFGDGPGLDEKCPYCNEGWVMIKIECDCASYAEEFESHTKICNGFRSLTIDEVEDMMLITDTHREYDNVVNVLMSKTLKRHIVGEIKLHFNGAAIKVIPYKKKEEIK